jgi:hypothetical protein
MPAIQPFSRSRFVLMGWQWKIVFHSVEKWQNAADFVVKA